MDDITIIMLTPNKVPKEWAKFHKEKLMEAIGDTPIITISKEPLDWGINLIQTEYGLTNLYKQMLRGAKLATTPWIAMADDDTLYPRTHFQFRPPEKGYYYNLNCWFMFTWNKPFYFHKPLPGNGLVIASRELVIEAIESRLAKNSELKGHNCNELGTDKETLQYDKIQWKPFYTNEPILSFYHPYTGKGQAVRKISPWPVRAYDIPVWGRAEEIVKKFRGG
jgi:hypothetical protein